VIDASAEMLRELLYREQGGREFAPCIIGEERPANQARSSGRLLGPTLFVGGAGPLPPLVFDASGSLNCYAVNYLHRNKFR
jgi:hypothetical protein